MPVPMDLSDRWGKGWTQAEWINSPQAVVWQGSRLHVTACAHSDFWRTTSYGFIHDDGHALLTDFPDNSALEVRFLLDYDQQFDQAGVLVWAASEHWLKAGVEISDGAPQLGAVVTRFRSDWSVAPVADWAGREVTVRASRTGDAVTIRARVDDEAFRLVRLAPLPEGEVLKVGPYCCAPTRAGLKVQFTSVRFTEADASLH